MTILRTAPRPDCLGAGATYCCRPRPLWVSLHWAAPSTRSGGIVVGALFGVNPEVLGAKIRRFLGHLVWKFWVCFIRGFPNKPGSFPEVLGAPRLGFRGALVWVLGVHSFENLGRARLGHLATRRRRRRRDTHRRPTPLDTHRGPAPRGP